MNKVRISNICFVLSIKHTLQYNTIQFNTIQNNTILYNTKKICLCPGRNTPSTFFVSCCLTELLWNSQCLKTNIERLSMKMHGYTIYLLLPLIRFTLPHRFINCMARKQCYQAYGTHSVSQRKEKCRCCHLCTCAIVATIYQTQIIEPPLKKTKTDELNFF